MAVNLRREAPIRLARRLRERGLSYVKIAAELERGGLPARTGRWHPQKVSNMLRIQQGRPAV